MTRQDEEFALRRGIEAVARGMSVGARFEAFLALRTVAYHLGLTEIHAELDALLKQICAPGEIGQ